MKKQIVHINHTTSLYITKDYAASVEKPRVRKNPEVFDVCWSNMQKTLKQVKRVVATPDGKVKAVMDGITLEIKRNYALGLDFFQPKLHDEAVKGYTLSDYGYAKKVRKARQEYLKKNQVVGHIARGLDRWTVEQMKQTRHIDLNVAKSIESIQHDTEFYRRVSERNERRKAAFL